MRDIRRSWPVYAFVLIVTAETCVFAPHLFGRALFMGDSDRLNTFLSIRKFEIESVQQGGVKAWSDFQFMGMATIGLAHMLPDPLMRLEALFPVSWLPEISGIVAWILVILAAVSAYAFIRDVVPDGFAAAVGAAIYPISTYGIMRIGQVDSSFQIFVHIPLALLLVRKSVGHLHPWRVLALAAVLSSMFLFTFLQEIVYATLLIGAYASYRALVSKSWTPLGSIAVAAALAGLTAAPRLVTVAGELRLLDRAPVGWAPNQREIWRFFYDGIFGRYHEEARKFANGINLHEGLLLYTSTFAALLVVYSIIRFRRRWLGLLRFSDAELSFHAWCLLAILGGILTARGQKIVTVLFLNASLLHARLSMVAILSICTLVAAALAELRRENVEGRARRPVIAFVIAAVIAFGLVWSFADPIQSILQKRLGVHPLRLADGMTMLPLELTRLAWATVLFGVLMVSLAVANARIRAMLATCIGLLIVMHTVMYASFKFYGRYAWTFPIPFKQNNFFALRPDQLRVPSGAALSALHDRLEVDRFRSALICDEAVYQVFCSPHVPFFWRLRVVDGYVPGVPRRLASLPWPPGVRTLRAIRFSSEDQLPWPLLSLLNVKYAVRVSPALYFNVPPPGADGGSESRLEDVEIVTNPLPVVPREFFARTVEAATDPEQALARLQSLYEHTGAMNVTALSVVEGIATGGSFVSDGEIRARYDQDRIVMRVEPRPEPRFLVLNELYHPRWRAYAAGREIPVHPVNVVMRGVAVPSDVSEIEFRFVPFLWTVGAKATFVTAAALAIGVTWGLRRG
jgi:hypothetical protein